jgi:chaperonin GroES
MKAHVLDDRVVVKKKEVINTNSFGIVIPEDKSIKTSEGEVIAVGEGKQLDNGIVREMTVKVGDTVIFPKGAGVEVKIEDIECIVLREPEIFGILE